jgi:hypothetical protein
MGQPALKDIAVRAIPATGQVAIDFQGLGADVRLHPGHAIALVDRVLEHLMHRPEPGIQQGLQNFAIDTIEAKSMQGMSMLVYTLANGLPFASHFTRDELTTLRNQIDALLAQPEATASH